MANDTDADLCDLTVDRARGEALARELDALHLGLGAASAVIPAGVRVTMGSCPLASIAMCRLRPTLRLAPSQPRLAPAAGAITVWLASTTAEGASVRPARW